MDTVRMIAGKQSWGILALSMIVAVLLAACPAEAPPAAPPPAEPEATPEEVPVAPDAEVFRLALVLIGEITDLSWNAQMHRAVMEVRDDLGIEVSVSEQVPDAEVERVLRDYAEDGYDLIIAHSFSFGDAVFRVAPDYPDTNFTWAGGIDRTADNVADYDQPFYQAAYLIGIIAGAMSESGVLNSLGGFDIPVCRSMAEAFALGAQHVNPEARLLSTYVGDWGDVARAKEAALAQIEAGADFAIACGEGPTLGAIEAAREQGALATGYVGDMTEIAPDAVIVSLVWNLRPLVELMVQETQDGAFQPGKFYSLGVADGAFEIAINPAFQDAIPAEALEELEAVRQAIIDGEFEVPYIPE